MKTLNLICLFLLLLAPPLLHAQNILDTTFDPGTGANGFVESTLVQPDGKILICGYFQDFNNSSRKFIARLHPNGTLDTTFNPAVSDWVRHMALQPDGKIVIVGFFKAVDDFKTHGVARLNANGSRDTTFNPTPELGATGSLGTAIDGNTNSFVFQTALQGDGKILITGNFTNYNGVRIHGIARLHPNGALDTTFNAGPGLNNWGRSIRVLPNNQILVTGWFNNYRNEGHDRMALINPDGSPDPGFNPSFGELTSVYDVAKLSDGKYIVVGHSINTNDVGGFYHRNIRRLNANGTVDTSFNAAADEKVESVRIQSDGKIVIGGYFSKINGTAIRSVARLNADGTLDSSFGAAIDNWIWTVNLSGGKILICGAFSTVNGVSRSGIARLNANGTPPVGEVPDPKSGDFLWRNSAGQLAAWFMNGTNRTGSGLLANGVAVGLSWQVAGLADFDHDSHVDLLWRNSNGQTAFWLMNGATIKSSFLLQPTVPVDWRLAGVADFNRDGQTDILWQHTGGQIAVWFMQGTNLTRSALSHTGPPSYQGWRIIGLADFNQDNETDFLWQHTDGQLAAWRMTGGTNYVGSLLGNKGPAPATGWRIAGLKDFNGDNRPDFLWENGQGHHAVWLINNMLYTSAFFLRGGQSDGTDWKLGGVF